MRLKMLSFAPILALSLSVPSSVSAQLKSGYPLVSGKMTQDFGVTWSEDRSKKHTGIDISSPKGTTVYAMHSGVIARYGWLGESRSGVNWGYYFVVKEDRGTVSAYLHINPLAGLTTGSRVTAGKSIGTVYRDHLHVNSCYQVAGCQHGAFTNATYPNGYLGYYYRRPAIRY